VIKNNKGNKNKLENMLSTPLTPNIIALGNLMDMEPVTHDAYIGEYS